MSQTICVDDGAPGNIHNPSKDQNTDYSENNEKDCPLDGICTVALAAGVQNEAFTAYFASVCAIGGTLGTAINDTRPADSSLWIWERLMWVCRLAGGRSCLDALEVAVDAVSTVVSPHRAFFRALRIVIVVGANNPGVMALRFLLIEQDLGSTADAASLRQRQIHAKGALGYRGRRRRHSVVVEFVGDDAVHGCQQDETENLSELHCD